MRRGSSGASITCVGDDVTKRKLDDDRVREQGDWLRRHNSPAVPYVFRVYEHSYVMERLVTPPVTLLDHRRTLLVMINQLATHVWNRQPVAPINHDMLQAKLERLTREFDVGHIWTWIAQTHGRIRWHDLHACLTHGDPTFDNVMVREVTGELVLVDPIPASLVVPDMRCVDVGKILQSALGWEEVRYGPEQRFNVAPAEVIYALMGDATSILPVKFDNNEREAAIFWTVVHLLRALPYVNDVVRARVRGKLIRDAISLL